MTQRRDVLLAGFGACSAAGPDVEAFWRALQRAPEAPSPNAIVPRSTDGRTWRHGHCLPASASHVHADFDSLIADVALQALDDARRRGHALDTLHTGLVLGTAAGDSRRAERHRLEDSVAPYATSHPYRAIDTLPHVLPIQVSGPAFVAANACSAGLHALVHAVDIIRAGMADAMIVIGADLLSHVTQSGFQRMTALDPQGCMPFDVRRLGTVLGEGAAALVLVADSEAAAHAGSAGRIRGIGVSCDAFHPTAPEPGGRDISRALREALRDANVGPDGIDVIVPHGTGTPPNDRIEGNILAAVLGPSVVMPPVLSVKAHIGHTAGASGLFSLLAAALALAHRKVPAGYCERPDPATRIRLPSRETPLRARRPLRALINACGFGGNNVSLVLQEGTP